MMSIVLSFNLPTVLLFDLLLYCVFVSTNEFFFTFIIFIFLIVAFSA